MSQFNFITRSSSSSSSYHPFFSSFAFPLLPYKIIAYSSSYPSCSSSSSSLSSSSSSLPVSLSAPSNACSPASTSSSSQRSLYNEIRPDQGLHCALKLNSVASPSIPSPSIFHLLLLSIVSGLLYSLIYSHTDESSHPSRAYKLRYDAAMRNLHSYFFYLRHQQHLKTFFASLRGQILDLRPAAAHHVKAFPSSSSGSCSLSSDIVYEAAESNILTWSSLMTTLESLGAPQSTFELTSQEPLAKLQSMRASSQDQITMMFCLSRASNESSDAQQSRMLLSPLDVDNYCSSFPIKVISSLSSSWSASAEVFSSTANNVSTSKIDASNTLTASHDDTPENDKDWRKILEECYRVLKPGGRLYAVEYTAFASSLDQNASSQSLIQQIVTSFASSSCGLRFDRPIAQTLLQQQEDAVSIPDSTINESIQWEQVYMECWNNAKNAVSREGITQVKMLSELQSDLTQESSSTHNSRSRPRISGLNGMFPLIAFIAVKPLHKSIHAYLRDTKFNVNDLFKYGERKPKITYQMPYIDEEN